MTRYNHELNWYQAETTDQLPEVNRPVFALIEEDVEDPKQCPHVIKLVWAENGYWYRFNKVNSDDLVLLEQFFTVIRWRYVDGGDKPYRDEYLDGIAKREEG